MRHFMLFYELADDYLKRRPEFRKIHLELAWASYARGELFLAGAMADPTDSAALLFRAADKSVAETFAKTDPYVINGLVKSWRVREWLTVAGDEAASPVKP
jgi:uncharacterized protein YciI